MRSIILLCVGMVSYWGAVTCEGTGPIKRPRFNVELEALASFEEIAESIIDTSDGTTKPINVDVNLEQPVDAVLDIGGGTNALNLTNDIGDNTVPSDQNATAQPSKKPTTQQQYVQANKDRAERRRLNAAEFAKGQYVLLLTKNGSYAFSEVIPFVVYDFHNPPDNIDVSVITDIDDAISYMDDFKTAAQCVVEDGVSCMTSLLLGAATARCVDIRKNYDQALHSLFAQVQGLVFDIRGGNNQRLGIIRLSKVPREHTAFKCSMTELAMTPQDIERLVTMLAASCGCRRLGNSLTPS